MKKRWIAVLLALLLLCSACSERAQPPQPAEQSAEKQEKPAASEQIVQPEPEKEPDVQQEPEPIPEQPQREALLLRDAEPIDGAGVLRYVPHARIEEGYEQIVRFGDLLIACDDRYNGTATDTYLLAIDLYSGEVTHEAVLKSADTAEIRACGDRLVLTSYANAAVTVLNAALETEAEYRISDEWCNFYVNDAVDTAYCFEVDGGLRIVDLASGEEALLLEEARSLFPNQRCGTSVSFSYVDVDTQRMCGKTLDLRDGTIADVPFDDASYQVDLADGVWLCSIAGEEDAYLLGSEPVGVITADGLPVLLPEKQHVLISDYRTDGSRTCTLYAADGTFLSAYEQVDWSYSVGDPVWAEPYGGYFFTVVDESGAVRLQFWDLGAAVSGEDLELQPYDTERIPAAGDTVSQLLYARAAELSERFGVTVRIAEQCDTEFTDYTVERNFDEAQITAGLDALEAALSAYPAGFFPQLLYGEYRGIEISLAGTLTRRDTEEGAGGFTSFNAFVEQKGTRHLMVFDLAGGSGIEQTCYHEFSHLIDEKLAFDARYRAGSNFSEAAWAAYNPAGFDYAYDYQELPSGFYNDGFDSYFIDLYSRTYPSEDRARILEYAMIGWDWHFAAGTPLREKLAYYAACIRDSFDTTGWDSVTAWEQPLSDS